MGLGFRCNVSERNRVVVITLQGGLERGNLAQLAATLDQVTLMRPTLVIINFHDLLTLEPACTPAISEFVRCLRGLSPVRACFLNENLSKDLLLRGVLVSEELRSSLMACLEGRAVPDGALKKAA